MIEVHVHHHHAHDDRIDEVLRLLRPLEDTLNRLVKFAHTLDGKVDQLMAFAQDTLDLLKEIDAATTEDGVLLADYFARLEADTVTADEKAAIFAAGKAVVAHLKGIGTNPNVPVPPLPAAARLVAKTGAPPKKP